MIQTNKPREWLWNIIDGNIVRAEIERTGNLVTTVTNPKNNSITGAKYSEDRE